ncbi:MAG: Fur family transcriptional regulator [Firmicutes bacterium]|nr:Fur family transcriptional regulator [Bacillota bacterium]
MSAVPTVQTLQAVGLKATPQRLWVLEALRHLSHPPAEAIFRYVVARHPGLSLATVYHVLDKFEEAGLVVSMEFHGKRYFDVRAEPHDHVHCRRCGRLDDVHRDPATRLVFVANSAWHIDAETVLWEGLCPSCREG